MSVRRPPALLLAVLLGLAWSVATATPAAAACHVAGFVEQTAVGDEGQGAVLVVELRGRVQSCAGTVDVATVDGTAVAGSDYEAFSATLEFVEGDDRVETIELVLLADEEAEGDETFTVELRDPTGGITGTGDPATVTILDVGGPEEPDAETATDDTATEDASTDEASDQGDEGEGAAVDADEVDAEDEGGLDPLLLAVVALAVVGLVAFLARRGRAG